MAGGDKLGRRSDPPAQTAVNAEFSLFTTTTTISLVSISLFALLVRILVSLGPYSGQSHPPKYGDYEAQRHWMEITIHTPPSHWYRNTSDNDLSYWGLDYPPLTAYQSYAHGLLFLNSSESDAVALKVSRGYESPKSKLLMRWTVLSSDLLLFFPAVIYFVYVYHKHGCIADGEDSERVAIGIVNGSFGWQLAMILLNPCLILIDHGHFQYNCISLGLTVGAVAAILCKHDIVGSVLFSLALNHKQMSAYFAPAFLGYLLGRCLQCQNPVVKIFKLGIAVFGTFALIWLPYLHSLEAVMEVLSRLAPFERGLYEDYVANFWCTSSIIIKWKKLFTIPSLKSLSFCATLVSFLPSMVHQIRAPSNLGFIYSLLNCSFSFYFFSYQVHEKSILLPLLPASLLVLEEPFAYGWLVHYGLLSMFPLLCRDHLILQYAALLALSVIIYYSPDGICNMRQKHSSTKMALMTMALSCSVVLHLIYLKLQPPKKYPFLFEALIMLLCFSQFVILAVYTNIEQWMLESSSRMISVKKNV